MQQPLPAPLRRYLLAGLLAAAALGGILLLVRSFLLGVGAPLDDTNYRVAGVLQARDGPMLVEVVLSESHGLPGEVHRDERVGLTVVVSPVGTDAFAVVAAWNPVNNCAVTLGADRLVDCQGVAWTFDGIPLDPADQSLPIFATTVRNGAVVVDFTRYTLSIS